MNKTNIKKGLKQGLIYFAVSWFGSIVIGGGISGVTEHWFGELILPRETVFTLAPLIALVIGIIAFIFYASSGNE